MYRIYICESLLNLNKIDQLNLSEWLLVMKSESLSTKSSANGRIAVKWRKSTMDRKSSTMSCIIYYLCVILYIILLIIRQSESNNRPKAASFKLRKIAISNKASST